MALFQRHHFLIFIFWFFLLFLPIFECDHYLGSLITLEVPFWAIILWMYRYISLSPLSDWFCGITFFSEFYSSAIAPYYRRFCLLLLLYCLFPPLMDECDQLLWSLIVNQFPCQMIISAQSRQYFVHDPCLINNAAWNYLAI